MSWPMTDGLGVMTGPLGRHSEQCESFQLFALMGLQSNKEKVMDMISLRQLLEDG